MGRGDASKWWYLVPLLFSILGGIIAYGALKAEDSETADNCIALGIVVFGFNLFVAFLWLLV